MGATNNAGFQGVQTYLHPATDIPTLDGSFIEADLFDFGSGVDSFTITGAGGDVIASRSGLSGSIYDLLPDTVPVFTELKEGLYTLAFVDAVGNRSSGMFRVDYGDSLAINGVPIPPGNVGAAGTVSGAGFSGTIQGTYPYKYVKLFDSAAVPANKDADPGLPGSSRGTGRPSRPPFPSAGYRRGISTSCTPTTSTASPAGSGSRRTCRSRRGGARRRRSAI